MKKFQPISRVFSVWVAASMAAVFLQANPAAAALPIESWTTDSGAKVMFMRAEALPMLDIRLDLPAGDRTDPKGKEGLAKATADTIGRGAEGMNENQVADAFADTGANFSGSAGEDSAGFQMRTLTSEPEYSKAIALFKLITQKPVFDGQVLERERARTLAGFKEELTKPEVLAQRAFSKALYPKHSYGALETEDSLKAFTLDDVKQLYKTRYLGNHAVVSIVGNITLEQANALANELTAGLPKGDLNDKPLGEATAAVLQAEMQGQNIQVDHPAAQSHVVMGLPALTRHTPEYFDLLVANHVLGGGGFESRLMKEVREKRGLAYSAYSYFMPLGDAGPFQAGLQTKRGQTDKAYGVMRQTILDFIANGPTDAEVQAAKQNLVGGFPLRVDSNGKLLGNLAMMGLYGLPLDYLDTWSAKVEKVTASSAREAFRKYVDPNKLVTVIVGGQPKTEGK